jgi:hypothetical protein
MPTIVEVLKKFKNELLETTLVGKLLQIILLIYQEIFTEMVVGWEIFMDTLAKN